MTDGLALSSTSSLARVARIVLFAFLALTLITGTFAFLVGDRFTGIGVHWNEFAAAPTEKGVVLSKLHDRIGYGGYIHNFKNYIIRNDRWYRDQSLKDYREVQRLIGRYESFGVRPREETALAAIRKTAAEYRKMIEITDALIAEGATVERIDQAVKVDDAEMIAALNDLHEIWRETFDQGRQTIGESVATGQQWSQAAQIAAALFLFAASAMAFWTLYRERALARAVRALDDDAQRFEGVVGNSTDGILTVDRNGRIEIFNPAAERILGYPQSEALGMGFVDLFPDDLHEESRVIEGNPEASFVNLPSRLHARTKEGASVPIEINIAPYRTNVGSHYVATFRDITARLKADIELRELKDAAEKANNAKSSFLASMSHELRTPLNAVIGFSQMLQIDETPELSNRQKEWTAHIFSAGTHLHELVSQILDLAQIERGKLSVELRSVDLAELVSGCVDQMAPYADQTDVTLKNLLPGSDNASAIADPTRLKQCLFNLLSNAIKYNRDGGDVTISGALLPTNVFRISVRDTGIGIGAEDRPYIFRMFQRFAETPELARDGAGIGLAVTDQLVQLMNGDLSFESVVNEGSHFWIDLPTEKSEPNASADPQSHQSANSSV